MRFLLLFFILSAFSVHEYYVSTCDIFFNEKAQQLEITLMLDTKDFEKALKERSTTKVRLGTKKEAVSSDSLVMNYLKDHLNFTINGNDYDWQYLGKEHNDHHETHFYMVVPDCEAPKTIEMNHSSLIHLFDQQSNIVHFDLLGNKETLVFQKGLEKQKLVMGEE